MQLEYSLVIADTSCFILLDNIGELSLLEQLFGHVVTTTVIAQEFGSALPDWIEVRAVKDLKLQATLDVDDGEASAITLALESGPSLLIIDDNKGRKAARKLNLKVTGTFGVLLKAKQSGILKSIKPIIEKIQQTNFRYSSTVINEILLLAGEL